MKTVQYFFHIGYSYPPKLISISYIIFNRINEKHKHTMNECFDSRVKRARPAQDSFDAVASPDACETRSTGPRGVCLLALT